MTDNNYRPSSVMRVLVHVHSSPVTNVDILGGLTPQHNGIPPQSCNLVFDLIVLFLQLCTLICTKCIANLIHNLVQSSALAIIIPFPSSSPFSSILSYRYFTQSNSWSSGLVVINCMQVYKYIPFTLCLINAP